MMSRSLQPIERRPARRHRDPFEIAGWRRRSATSPRPRCRILRDAPSRASRRRGASPGSHAARGKYQNSAALRGTSSGYNRCIRSSAAPVRGGIEHVAAVLEDALRRVERDFHQHDAAGLAARAASRSAGCPRSACSETARAATRCSRRQRERRRRAPPAAQAVADRARQGRTRPVPPSPSRKRLPNLAAARRPCIGGNTWYSQP